MIYQIIFNPEAGRGKAQAALPVVQYHLKRAKIDYQIHQLEAVADHEVLIQSFGKDDVVVALGGDGTVNALLPGLLKLPRKLAVIPTGMINNLARAAGISRRVPEAVRTMLTGTSKLVDIGVINHQKYFINGMGIGFDGQVNLEGNEIQTMAGNKVYIIAIAKAFRKFEPILVHLELNGGIIDTAIFQLVIGNSPFMGGGFRLTPDALMDDGALDIALVEPLKKGRIVRNIRKLRNGQGDVLNEVHLDRTTELIFASTIPIPVHYDGEIFQSDDLRMEVAVIPAAIHLIGDWNN